MRFLDTNVLVYALLQTERKLTSKSETIKNSARKIVSRVQKGEQAFSSLIHLSELTNILQDNMPRDDVNEIVENLLDNDNFIFLEVDNGHYATALEITKENRIGLNDALAIVLMRKAGIFEIYSFDKHFDKIHGVKKITS